MLFLRIPYLQNIFFYPKKFKIFISLTNQFLDFKIINVSDTNSIIDACNGSSEKGIFLSYQTVDKSLESFLAKILSAVKLDLQTDVLTLEKTLDNDFSFSTLSKAQSIHTALFFGISPKAVGLQVDCHKYHPFSIDGCLFLFADDLKGISENQTLKKALWEALQAIFKKEE